MSGRLFLRASRFALKICTLALFAPQILLVSQAQAKKNAANVIDFSNDANPEGSGSSGGLPESARIIAPRKKRVWFFDRLPAESLKSNKATAKDASKGAKDSGKDLAKDSGKETAVAAKSSKDKPAATPTGAAKKTKLADAAAKTSKGTRPASVEADSDSAAGPRRALNSIELRDHAQGAVFALETRLDKNAAKASYGTAFVVRNDGHLLTNYHVVSQAILKPDRYQLFLRVDRMELPASVVSFDILNDLAIVKVNRAFKHSLTLDNRLPTRGEKIYSIGLPQDTSMTLVEGTFSDEQAAGFTNFLVLSAPLNPGMSGGPTLDATGVVIGVNEGMLAQAQNMAFVVPARDAQKFMNESRNYISGAKTAFRSEKDGRKEIQRQVASFDDGWKRSWRQSKPLELRDWKVKGIPSYLRCWQDRRDEDKKALNTEVVRCRSLASISIGENSQAGTVDIEFASLEELNYHKVLFNLNNLREKNFGPALAQFKKGGEDSDQLGKYLCRHDNVELSGLPFLAEVCMTRINSGSPLFDTVVFLTWLDEHPRKFMASMQLSGFTRDQSMFAVKQFVDSVERKPQP